MQQLPSLMRCCVCGILEEAPPDEHPPDLARAGADLVELGVAQEAACRVLIDVPIAPKHLKE